MKFKNDKALAKFVSEQLGGTLWLVGGAVRDLHMNKTPHDKDYVITGVDVQYIPFEHIVGSKFPVFLVKIDGKTCEVALARTEQKSGVGYHGFTFHSDKGISIQQDLGRRDLTINAMAINVATGDLVDPYNGVHDISNGVIRHTRMAFAEDPLRVYRVARFSAQFGFRIHHETLALMKCMKSELRYLSAERVWQETLKALGCDNSRRFFEVLKEADVLDVHFQAIDALNVPDMHDGTVFNHTMNLINMGATPIERFMLLVHDIGKGVTGSNTKNNEPYRKGTHYKHAERGEWETHILCQNLKTPNLYRDAGVLSASQHMRIKNITEMRPGKILKWLLPMKETNAKALLRVSFIDSLCRVHTDEEYADILSWWCRAGLIIDAVFQIEKEVTGASLIAEGVEPGQRLGQMLLQRRIERLKEIII